MSAIGAEPDVAQTSAFVANWTPSADISDGIFVMHNAAFNDVLG